MTIQTLLAAAVATAIASSSFAAVTLSPMTSFGGGDGWYSPGETVGSNTATYITTDNSQRSLAYNPATNSVLLANNLSVRVLNASSGDSVGLLDTTGVSGGTRALNAIGATSDGVIYGVNLTTNSTTSPYKVYRWATQGGVPTNTYSGNAGLAGSRLGDSVGVGGTDASGYVASGFGTTPAVAGNNGFSVVTTGATGTATGVGFTVTPPLAGDFRLSIAGVDNDTIYGTQGSGASGRLRLASFSGSAGTLDASIQLTSASERGMDYAEYTFGSTIYKLLATIDTVSSLVRVYDVSGVTNSTTSLTPIASGNNTLGTLTANGNATSSVAFGALTATDAYTANIALYAMSTNQGVQAFNVVVPEPTTLTGLAGLGMLMARRRK